MYRVSLLLHAEEVQLDNHSLSCKACKAVDSCVLFLLMILQLLRPRS